MSNDFDIQKKLAEKEESNKKANERLEEYRKELATLKEHSGDLFEKQLSYISAGALGFSMIAIEKLFKNIGTTEYRPIIILSWVCFGLTLFINLVSHLHAGYLHNKSMSDIDSEKYEQNTIIKRNYRIEFVNYISVAILFFGVCFFIIYTAKNIYSMNNTKPAITNNNDGNNQNPTPSQSQRMNEGKSATPPPPVVQMPKPSEPPKPQKP